METENFQNVKNPFKKAFKRHHEKLYKTVQSKPVEIAGETYVFFGEMRLQAFYGLMGFMMRALVVIALLSDQEFEFVVLLPFAFFFFVGSFVMAQNKRRLIAKNNTYLMELRAVSGVEEEPQEVGG